MLEYIYEIADQSPELHRALDEDVYRHEGVPNDPDYVYSRYFRKQGFTSIASVRANLRERLDKALKEAEQLERKHEKGAGGRSALSIYLGRPVLIRNSRVPLADMLPSWTVYVAIVVAIRKRQQSGIQPHRVTSSQALAYYLMLLRISLHRPLLL